MELCYVSNKAINKTIDTSNPEKYLQKEGWYVVGDDAFYNESIDMYDIDNKVLYRKSSPPSHLKEEYIKVFNSDIKKQRAIAYADPVSGVDCLVMEYHRKKIMGLLDEKSETLMKNKIEQRYKEIKDNLRYYDSGDSDG